MTKRKAIDGALEREAQLVDRRTELGRIRLGRTQLRGFSSTESDPHSHEQELAAVRTELAMVRARIARLIENGERPSGRASVLAFQVLESATDSGA